MWLWSQFSSWLHFLWFQFARRLAIFRPWLNALVDKTGRTKTYYAREALLNHIEDLEHVYGALEVLENPGREWTLEELEQEVDLQD